MRQRFGTNLDLAQIGTSDQRNTIWDAVESEGDRDDTHVGFQTCLGPKKQIGGTDGIRDSR